MMKMYLPYSLLQNQKDMTMLDLEQSLASNICRCTGYRSILDAFKTFATDAPKTIEIPDIEDLSVCKTKSCNKPCDENDWCVVTMNDLSIDDGIVKINLKDGKFWYRVTRIVDVFKIIAETNASYKLICGNTAKGEIHDQVLSFNKLNRDEYVVILSGVYPNDDILDNPEILIDIKEVPELKGYILDQNLIVGAENTLSELLDIFEAVAKEEYFSYLNVLHDHIKLVAHVAVRNVSNFIFCCVV